MVRYYCSGFDINNAFGHGLGEMFKAELKNTKKIVYIPGGVDKIEKAKTKHVPIFTNHFKNVGIEFDTVNLITPDLSPDTASKMCKEASFIMLLGGCPFKQKTMCEKLGIIQLLKNFDVVMLGFSAGAMLMSKYIITTPCSEEYADFRIENGLNLDGITIFPHNNTSSAEYPQELKFGDETYRKNDLLKLVQQCGPYYLLQDNPRPDGLTDISFIKSIKGKIEICIENDGKIWQVDQDIKLLNNQKIMRNNQLPHKTR